MEYACYYKTNVDSAFPMFRYSSSVKAVVSLFLLWTFTYISPLKKDAIEMFWQGGILKNNIVEF